MQISGANASKVEASVRDEIGIILKNGFSDAEISAGKASWIQSQQVTRSQDPSLATRLANYARFGRTMAWDADIQKKVEALTSDEMASALRRHLDLSAMTFVKGGEFKKAARPWTSGSARIPDHCGSDECRRGRACRAGQPERGAVAREPR